jgi:hypothetical protein
VSSLLHTAMLMNVPLRTVSATILLQEQKQTISKC